MTQKTVLFDIDGTIADIRHRRIFVEGDKPDWAKFNASMGDDVPNIPIVTLYHSLWKSGDFDLILVTGRNEQFCNITEQWLTWNEIPFSRIIMRKDKDNRADHVVKEEILDQLLTEGIHIEFTVDDRQQVVDMWRRRGFMCLQCDVGDF